MARIKVKEDEFSISQVAKKARGEAPSSLEPKKKASLPNISLGYGKLAVFATILIFLFLAAYTYSLRQETKDLRDQITKLKTDPAVVARQQNEQLLQKVASLVELPSNETPTIADVTDAQQAKAQDKFYVDARNGDKVLFYTQAGKAILYRPATNKVINTTSIVQPKQ